MADDFYRTMSVGNCNCCFYCFFARETDLFMKKRMQFLKNDIAKKENGKITDSETKEQKGKTGVIEGMRYIWKNKRLKFLVFAGLLIQIPTLALTSYYQSIMHLSGMSDSQITTALFAYPFIFAAFNIITGKISDKIGRKPIITVTGIGFCVFYILFVISCMLGWPPLLVGALYAFYLSCF